MVSWHNRGGGGRVMDTTRERQTWRVLGMLIVITTKASSARYITHAGMHCSVIADYRTLAWFHSMFLSQHATVVLLDC